MIDVVLMVLLPIVALVKVVVEGCTPRICFWSWR